MGIFDIFNTNDQTAAANAQTGALNQGYNQLSQLYGQGNQALNTNYANALPAYNTNYNTANAGQQQYAALLGLGGQGGAASGSGPGAATTAPGGTPPPAGGSASTPDLQALLANIPGYQFDLNQGSQNVLRNAASTGTTASGGTLNALQQQGQGAASQNYFNYLGALQPEIGAAGSAASGIAGVDTGLGNALSANATGQGNAALGTQAGIGSAQANADLAGLTASGNFWGSLLGGAKSVASLPSSSLGGSAIKGLFS